MIWDLITPECYYSLCGDTSVWRWLMLRSSAFPANPERLELLLVMTMRPFVRCVFVWRRTSIRSVCYSCTLSPLRGNSAGTIFSLPACRICEIQEWSWMWPYINIYSVRESVRDGCKSEKEEKAQQFQSQWRYRASRRCGTIRFLFLPLVSF